MLKAELTQRTNWAAITLTTILPCLRGQSPSFPEVESVLPQAAAVQKQEPSDREMKLRLTPVPIQVEREPAPSSLQRTRDARRTEQLGIAARVRAGLDEAAGALQSEAQSWQDQWSMLTQPSSAPGHESFIGTSLPSRFRQGQRPPSDISRRPILSPVTAATAPAVPVMPCGGSSMGGEVILSASAPEDSGDNPVATSGASEGAPDLAEASFPSERGIASESSGEVRPLVFEPEVITPTSAASNVPAPGNESTSLQRHYAARTQHAMEEVERNAEALIVTPTGECLDKLPEFAGALPGDKWRTAEVDISLDRCEFGEFDGFLPAARQNFERMLKAPWKFDSTVTNAMKANQLLPQSAGHGCGPVYFDEHAVQIRSLPAGMSESDILSIFAESPNRVANSAMFDRLNTFHSRGVVPGTVGSVLDIDIGGPDNGTVLIVDKAPRSITVETAFSEPYGIHPEFGRRQFGFETSSDGTRYFFTRGISQSSNPAALYVGPIPQRESWKALCQGVADTINKLGGEADFRTYAPKRIEIK